MPDLGKPAPLRILAARPRRPLCRPAALLCLWLFPEIAVLAQTTIHVPTDQPTIQAGINASNNGDTVLVAPGTYSEAIDFKGKAITVESSGGPATTIIDGTNQAFVVTFQSGETRNSILSGFTIQNGGKPFSAFETNDNISYETTGGIKIQNYSQPTITGNIITNNGCSAIFSADGSPLIQNNEISYNLYPAAPSGQYPCAYLYAQYLFAESPIYLMVSYTDTTAAPIPAVISGNTIENNSFSSTGSLNGTVNVQLDIAGNTSIDFNGQGVYYVIENNVIRNNVHSDIQNFLTEGGGMYVAAPGIIDQNLIYGNQADEGAGLLFTGPGFWNNGNPSPTLYYDPSLVWFVNNLVGYNIGSVGDSQIEVDFPSLVEFANNVVIGNSSLPAVWVSQSFQANAIFDHNDIYNPDGPGLHRRRSHG
ncbi:MAG: right-handed parallel beta-helix repeat-containing protein [Solirubrobacteraceae bacterium]